MPSIEGGGVEKNLFIISNYLSSKLKGVTLITTSKKFNNFFRKIKIINPKSNLWDNFSRRAKYIICLIILMKLIYRDKNYVVFAFQANLYCTIICKLFGIKIIIRSNSSPSGWSKGIIKQLMYKYLLKLADSIIVNSLDFQKEFKKIFNVKSICIYNPLNKKEIIQKSKKKLSFPFFKNKNHQLNIINVARFTDQKDHMTLLKAVNLIKNRIKFKLLIVGRGVNKEKMLNFINENGLQKKVKVINFQNNPYKYIARSNLFILTSTFEGLPNVLLEAIVLKKFIISSNCPTGPREILINGKGGELFNVGNHKALSQKIESFYHNEKKYQKKINISFKSLHRFDYYLNLQKYLNVVKKFNARI
jgi:glycosyltransferase involved in cell wall biosynthesis